jgi:excisionase family DNA binding protein
MKLFDVNGAAQILTVSPWTVRSYIRQGKLKAVRLGKLVRVDEAELLKLITESTGAAPNKAAQ